MSIDEPVEVAPGERATLRHLAAAGRVTIWHSLSYRSVGGDTREAWFADLEGDPTKGTWEIAQAEYDQLRAMGTAETPARR